MKKYTIKLEEKELTVSKGNGHISELECVLSIWQDLRKLNSEYPEDKLIENLTTQVLRAEYGDDIPKGYVGEKIVMTDKNMDALKQKAAAKVKSIEEGRKVQS
jgi:hypothetical protein